MFVKIMLSLIYTYKAVLKPGVCGYAYKSTNLWQ
jgi:hypothetical protein